MLIRSFEALTLLPPDAEIFTCYKPDGSINANLGLAQLDELATTYPYAILTLSPSLRHLVICFAQWYVFKVSPNRAKRYLEGSQN